MNWLTALTEIWSIRNSVKDVISAIQKDCGDVGVYCSPLAVQVIHAWLVIVAKYLDSVIHVIDAAWKVGDISYGKGE